MRASGFLPAGFRHSRMSGPEVGCDIAFAFARREQLADGGLSREAVGGGRVISAVVAPALVAIGAIAAPAKHYTIVV